jgi:hypothetical protein
MCGSKENHSGLNEWILLEHRLGWSEYEAGLCRSKPPSVQMRRELHAADCAQWADRAIAH